MIVRIKFKRSAKQSAFLHFEEVNGVFLLDDITRRISNAISARAMSDLDFFEEEIRRWRCSPERLEQIRGHLYYGGRHDILFRKRTVIGEGGALMEVGNLPNNCIVDNQYKKLVRQKVNYLLGQPFLPETDNPTYAALLKDIFDKRFMRTLKNAGKAALNGGIAWLYPYYNSAGELRFRVFPAYEILPYWKDSEHTELDCAVRLYSVEGYENRNPIIINKVEIFDASGVRLFTLSDSGRLVPDGERSPYVRSFDETGENIALNWQRIPLIALKHSEEETPLLNEVKTLQDGLNIMLSDFENRMQEDSRNTILVLKNYDGTDLGEFRRNLATYGAVKVRYDGETKGGVETLEIEVNCENYRSIIEIFKKSIIENGAGFDAKDDRLSGNPNQMNIQSMYSDIDLDANDFETELQAAFEDLLFFVNAYLANSGKGDFSGEKVSFIFNRDILINEREAIENCVKSVGILSDETIVGQHPWIDDKNDELRRIAEQKKRERTELDDGNYGGFPHENGGVSDEEKAGGILERKV